jgi:hypothetical protein
MSSDDGRNSFLINSQVKMAFGTITAMGNKAIESLLHPFGESRSNQHFFDSSPKC